MVDYVPGKDYGMTAKLWGEWAPGLVLALGSMVASCVCPDEALGNGGV